MTLKRTVVASRQGRSLKLTVAKKSEFDNFILAKAAVKFHLDGTYGVGAINSNLVVSQSGETIWDDDDENKNFENSTETQELEEPVKKPAPASGQPLEFAGGTIYFSTDIDKRHSVYKKRIDTDPEGKQKLVNTFDFSIGAINDAVQGWAETMYNRLTMNKKLQQAMMDFFNKHKMFVGHSLLPKGVGTYINPYQDGPDKRPQYTQEQSYVLIAKGLPTELLIELADFIRKAFHQEQVLIQDDNAGGHPFLYPPS